VGLLALSAYLSCATAPQPEPDWYRNTDAVYPSDRFIAYQGRGKTPSEARQNALADLAAYFEQEVQKKATADRNMIERQGAGRTPVEKTRRIEETITVTVKRNLSTVRYAEDAWRDPVTKEYVTVVYIDREEYWTNGYNLQAQNAALTFLLLVQGAQEETDPFTRALRFGKAEAYAEGEFIAVRSFAQALHPEKAQAEKLLYDADALRPALPGEADAARRNASVYLDCPYDLEGRIINAATAVFSAAGFPIAANRLSAAAICVIEVNEGLVPRPPGTGIFYRPELSGTVTSRAGTPVFSFNIQAEVQSAIDPELAFSRVYTGLAEAVRNTLPEQLMR
jgi:hypothetical protein